MKFVITLSLLLAIAYGFESQADSKNSRSVAQNQNHFGSFDVGTFSFNLSQDPDTEMDILTVTTSKGEKVCSYSSKEGVSERFLEIDADKNPLAFSKDPNRFIAIKWSLPSSVAKVELKILDVSQRGGPCVFVGPQKNDQAFLGLGIEYHIEDDALKVTEISAKKGNNSVLLGKLITCTLDSQSAFVCEEGKLTPYLQGNP